MAVLNLDKPRRLRFGVTAAREFKREFGASLVTVLTTIMKSAADGRGEALLDLDNATNLLWAALRHEDRALTVDRAASLLEAYLDKGGTLREFYEQLNEAFSESARVWGFVVEEEGKAQESARAT